MQVGFIGLGNMGRPMAANLVRKGFHVRVHDVARDRVRALETLGAAPAADVRDVATRERRHLHDAAGLGERDAKSSAAAAASSSTVALARRSST